MMSIILKNGFTERSLGILVVGLPPWEASRDFYGEKLPHRETSETPTNKSLFENQRD